jgi:flagellin
MVRISTNLQSIAAQRHLGSVVRAEEKESIKLSSGSRIAQAAYDPSGLAIATGMQAKSRSNLQVQRNVNDSISLFQVAEGTLSVMHDIAGRLRELSMQAANDTLGDSERFVANKEYKQLVGEVKRLTESTKFNGNHLINGQGSVYDFQIGVNNDPKADRIRYNLQEILDSGNNFGLSNTNILTKEQSQKNLGVISKMTEEVSSSRAKIGSAMNRMTSTINNLQYSHENNEASRSKIADTDFAKSTANNVKNSVIKDVTTSMLAQANTRPEAAARLLLDSIK